jgi:formamidopyrimidine-DNA glycosylase
MPELAEVEYFRKQWDPGLNQVIHSVQLHREARVFRDCDTRALERGLTGLPLTGSMAAGKQMAFRSSTGGWLGIHLGMTGSLAHYPSGYRPLKADHLVLSTPAGALVFSDPRMFGRVDFSEANQTPAWWARIPAPVASESFTSKDLVHFLNRRRKSPLKAVLLMQERFPGIGNWMADEILWRAELHPRLPAGALTADADPATPPRMSVGVPSSLGDDRQNLQGSAKVLALSTPLARGRTLSTNRRGPRSGNGGRAHHLLVPGAAAAVDLCGMNKPAKKRLDELLVHRGMAESRAQAKALIMAGAVHLGTERLDKPGKELPIDVESLRVNQPPRFVSRGGEKLAAFLERFGVVLQGAHVLDVGASTGGFTDCVLQGGAADVVCVDVGRAQLHAKLRRDPRVTNLEQVNARHLDSVPRSRGLPTTSS